MLLIDILTMMSGKQGSETRVEVFLYLDFHYSSLLVGLMVSLRRRASGHHHLGGHLGNDFRHDCGYCRNILRLYVCGVVV